MCGTARLVDLYPFLTRQLCEFLHSRTEAHLSQGKWASTRTPMGLKRYETASNDIKRFGTRLKIHTVEGAYRELEEPVVPGGAVLALQDEATVPDELVAVIVTVSETITNKIEADSSEASIKQVLEHNVAAVFVANRSGGKLQAPANQ